jgi:hypothetical protein
MTTAELVESSKQTQESQNQNQPTQNQPNHAPLFDEREAVDLRGRWQSIQGSFVDDPQASVVQADQLVATAIQRLAEIFAHEKANLENAWSRSGDVTSAVSTEEMRQALRRYRSFFDRILSV